MFPFVFGVVPTIVQSMNLCSRQHLALIALALLVTALTGTNSAGASPGLPIVLTPVVAPDGNTHIEIKNPNWPGNVWELWLPEYLDFGQIDRNLVFRVRRHEDSGKVTLSGVHHRVRMTYTFILTPLIDAVEIRATISNNGVAPFSPNANAGSCLAFDHAPEFRDSIALEPLAMFGGEMTGVLEAQTGRGGPRRRRTTFNLYESPGNTDDGLTAGSALIIKSSRDGTRHVGLAWDNAASIGYDMGGETDCVSSNPLFGGAVPGESRVIVGRIYFHTGAAADLYESFASDFPELGYGIRSQAHAVATIVEGRYRIEAKVVDREIRVSVSSDSTVGEEVVRIHRKVLDEFAYTGKNHSIIVDTTVADFLYETRMTKNSAFSFVDADAKYGDVHAYWISAGAFKSAPATVRVRAPELWWSKRQVDEQIEALADRFPYNIRVRRHGNTTEGWPLRSLSVGNSKKQIVIVGGIHPGESGPEVILPVFAALSRHEWKLLQRVGVTVLPLVNADTRQRIVDGYPQYLRRNPNGVDINRNFNSDWQTEQTKYEWSTSDPESPTYRGGRPESEKETQAVVDFLSKTHPVAVLSLHGPGSLLLTPDNASPTLKAQCQEIADTFLAAYEPSLRGRIPGGIMASQPMPGSLPAWVEATFNVPAFDQENDATPECVALVEHRLTREDIDTLRARNYNTVRALLVYFAENPTIRE